MNAAPFDALIVLWSVVLTVSALVFWRHRHVSLLTLSLVGLLAYSVPALIGVSVRLSSTGVEAFYPASRFAIYVVACGWLGFGLGVLIMPLEDGGRGALSRTVMPRSRQTAFLCLVAFLMLGLYLLCGLRFGLAFFLVDRDLLEARLGALLIPWRWMIAIGLVSAAVFQRWGWLAFYGVFAVIMVVAGDRTVFVISTMAALVAIFSSWTWKRAILSYAAWLSAGFMLTVIFLAKPVYVALKTGSGIVDSVLALRPMAYLGSWEAFVIHEQLERVISADFVYSSGALITGVLAQFFIVPSFFGVDSNNFNSSIQSALFSEVNFGIAGNYWAQWYAIGDLPAVIFGGLILSACIMLLQRAISSVDGIWSMCLLLIGAILAVYVYRNSIENILALIRQVLAIFACTYLGWMVVSAISLDFRTSRQAG